MIARAIRNARGRRSAVCAALCSLLVCWSTVPLNAADGTAASPPDWSGWWGNDSSVMADWEKSPPPLRPGDLARFRGARAADSSPDPGRFCRPPQFTGYSGGLSEALEFLFTPGRVTLTNEAGLIRRIYTDGRPLPKNPGSTNTGTSVGHWEGQTLVVETVGINPGALYPLHTTHAAMKIGKNVKITERISLLDANSLQFEIETVAPDLFTAIDKRKRVYNRLPNKTAASEVSYCLDYDRSIDPKTGKQRFDLTPPPDLAPPPPPPKAQ
jgi:hypothetical protein